MKLSTFIEKNYLIILILIISFILANYFTRFLVSLNNKRRIANYSLNINDHLVHNSIIDKIIVILESLINKVTVFLNKYKIFKNFSLRYQKYNYQNKDNSYYLAIKIITGMTFLIIYLITVLLSSHDLILVLLPLILLTGFFLPDFIFLYNHNKYLVIIKNNFLEAVIMLNNLFKGGLTITEAINSMKDNLTGPLQKEFNNIAVDLSYGISINDAFLRFYNRIGLEDIKYLVNALTIVNITGGEATKIFDDILTTLINKQKLNLEIKKITIKNKILTKIFIVIPFLAMIALSLINKDYFEVLYKTPKGVLVLGLIVSLYLGYIFTIRKVLKVQNYVKISL